MKETLQGVVHNGRLDIEGKLNFPEGEKVTIFVTTAPAPQTERRSFFKRAAELDIEAPSDFSENIDEYLYRGKPID